MSWKAVRYRRLPHLVKKKRPQRNRHHLVPRSRGGSNHFSNLLYINVDRHENWHRVFGNMTIDEVLELLTRMKRMKDNQKNPTKRRAA